MQQDGPQRAGSGRVRPGRLDFGQPGPGRGFGEADAAAYLRANPDFLEGHPGLYDVLAPPARVHGSGLADHMQAMLERARVRAAEAERMAAHTAATRRAAEGFTRRVQETVLALMRAADPAWLAIHELAGLLRLDAARVCSEAARPVSGVASVPRGTVGATLGQRAALVQPAPRPLFPDPALPGRLLHGEAAGLATEEAFVRVPLRQGPAVLALAARDAVGLGGATTDALAFLGQAVGAALDRTA